MKIKLYLITGLTVSMLNVFASEKEVNSFENLPDQVIVDILIPRLEHKGIIRLSQTSKRMRKLAKLVQQNEFKNKLQYGGTLLDLSFQEIEALFPGVFDDPAFKNLEKLNISQNRLTNLPKNIFKELKYLEKLDLTGNQLIHLDVTLFKDLDNLEELALSQNRLTNLEKDLFKNLKRLKMLFLVKNELTRLDKATFKSAKRLEVLYLSQNPLADLDKDTFKGLNNISDMGLSNTELKYLDQNIFKGLENLRSLGLAGNKLTTENIKEILKDFNNLESLCLDIKHVEKIQETLPGVFIMDYNS